MQGKCLYLMDILCQMQFYDREILNTINFNDKNDRYRKLKVLLRSQNTNLLVVSSEPDYPADIQLNLFKIFCAMYNLKSSVQTGQYVLDEELLE